MLTIVLLAFGLEPLSSEWLAYHHEKVSDGQWWRFVTANLLHTNATHLLLNATGVVLLWALHGQYYKPLGYLGLVLLLGLASTLGIHFTSPELLIYVGLSGVLNGLFVWGAIEDIKHGYRSGWLLLLFVLGKIGYEQWQGADTQVAKLIDAQVAINAHLFGVLAALILATIWFVMGRTQPTKAPS